MWESLMYGIFLVFDVVFRKKESSVYYIISAQ